MDRSRRVGAFAIRQEDQSEAPDILEEGTYPKALWFVGRTYLPVVS
jgi:hypothetical protein